MWFANGTNVSLFSCYLFKAACLTRATKAKVSKGLPWFQGARGRKEWRQWEQRRQQSNATRCQVYHCRWQRGDGSENSIGAREHRGLSMVAGGREHHAVCRASIHRQWGAATGVHFQSLLTGLELTTPHRSKGLAGPQSPKAVMFTNATGAVAYCTQSRNCACHQLVFYTPAWTRRPFSVAMEGDWQTLWKADSPTWWELEPCSAGQVSKCMLNYYYYVIIIAIRVITAWKMHLSQTRTLARKQFKTTLKRCMPKVLKMAER